MLSVSNVNLGCQVVLFSYLTYNIILNIRQYTWKYFLFIDDKSGFLCYAYYCFEALSANKDLVIIVSANKAKNSLAYYCFGALSANKDLVIIVSANKAKNSLAYYCFEALSANKDFYGRE
jgi:hypothetical protein